MKKSLPEKYQKRTEASMVTALVSATVATLMCYPLDTVRRQMQLKGTPYVTVLDAIPGNVSYLYVTCTREGRMIGEQLTRL